MAKPGDMGVFDLPFNGRLITKADPGSIGPNFQALTNMRYTDFGIEGIYGATRINTTALTNAGTPDSYIGKSGFHYKKDQPAESHILVQGENNDGDSTIIQNKTAVPSQGDFETADLFTDTTGAEQGVFSSAPGDAMAYANGKNTCIWGGDETFVGAFINFDTTGGTFDRDFTEAVSNTRSSSAEDYAVLKRDAGTKTSFYIASPRPIQGFKLYFTSTVNTAAATMAVNYWNGSAWTSVPVALQPGGVLGDNTSSGGKSLSQTGTVTFDTTVGLAKTSLLYGLPAYWYQVIVSGADDNVQVYYATVNAPFQEIVDVWDGISRYALACYSKLGVATYEDNTTNVYENEYDSTDEGTYLDLLDFTGSLILGFAERQTAVEFVLSGEYVNINTSADTVTVSYWNGSAWTTVGTVTDGTKANKCMDGSGVISWNAISPALEFRKQEKNSPQLYYYKLDWNFPLYKAAGTTGVRVQHISGIPAQKTISKYRLCAHANDRLWLANEWEGYGNKLIGSAYQTSQVFNGDDYIELYIGNASDITGMATAYVPFEGGQYEMLVVCKQMATYAVYNNGQAWIVRRISDSIGCVAPNTMRSVNLAMIDSQAGAKRQGVMWLGANGVYLFDGYGITLVSNDISDIFEHSVSSGIDRTYAKISYAFIDEEHLEYHLLIPYYGSTVNNREYVFDIKRLKWWQADRSGAKLRFGIQAFSSTGQKYVYGYYIDSDNNGRLVRVEDPSGSTGWDGQSSRTAVATWGYLSLSKSPNDLTGVRSIKLIAHEIALTGTGVSFNYTRDGDSSDVESAVVASEGSNTNYFPYVQQYKCRPGAYHYFGLSQTQTSALKFQPQRVGIVFKHIRTQLSDGG